MSSDSSGWFASLGRWDQHAAYAAFDTYRSDPTQANYDEAIIHALSIIRVVYSTQKFRVSYGGDEDDLISHAALIITKALPKMTKKPKEALGDDKQYMRYLFSCVVNAFYREYEILHGKHNKLTRKIVEQAEKPSLLSTTQNFRQFEASSALKKLPEELNQKALELLRFEDKDQQICVYILNQLIEGREVAKSVLQLMGCKDRNFFIGYCQSLLFQAFLQLRKNRKQEELYEQDYVEEEFDFEEIWEPSFG